jgi:hypothetical protein
MSETIRLYNDKCRPWLVRLVRQGDRYGRDDCLVHDELAPMVEFYDLVHVDKFGPRGQFVSRYCLQTLLGRDEWSNRRPTDGINLHLGVEVWSVDSQLMGQVMRWLTALGEIEQSADMARRAFVDRFADRNDAMAFETSQLDNHEFLPECALHVRNGGVGTREYWWWLCQQLDECEAD